MGQLLHLFGRHRAVVTITACPVAGCGLRTWRAGRCALHWDPPPPVTIRAPFLADPLLEHLNRALDYLDRDRHQWARAVRELEPALALKPRREVAGLIDQAIGICRLARIDSQSQFFSMLSGWDQAMATAEREQRAEEACDLIREAIGHLDRRRTMIRGAA